MVRSEQADRPPTGDGAAPQRQLSGLLTAKIAAPRTPPELVVRRRLLERLAWAGDRRVTLVSAGPGWGKTALVASWVSSLPSSEPWAWVTLDSHDNDPVLFWSYVLAAVRGAEGAGGTALDELTVHPPVGPDLLRRIALGLAELERPLTLVLDDFGVITNPDVNDGIAELLRLPLQLRLVLITRVDPRVGLHRLRAEGALNEVRASDLAFTPAEAAALLEVSGVTLPEELSRRVLDRTEGWAVALRLVAMVGAGPDPMRRIEDFAGDDGAVAEYLVEEVLSEVDEDQRAFLLRTSVADRLCGELADVLSGETGGHQRLDDLAQANAFVLAAGPGRVWFRYHPLMTDLLRHRLLLEEPRLVPELHRRAALWFAGRGEVLQAVDHAVRGRDWQLVGELMVSGAALRVVTAERMAFDELLTQIPETVIPTSPELCLCGCVRSLLARDYDAMARYNATARALLAEAPEPAAAAVSVLLGVTDLVVARAQGDNATLLAVSREILAWSTEAGDARRTAAATYEWIARTQLGLGLVWAARDTEAEPELRSGLRGATAAGAELTAINNLGYLGLMELVRGQLSAATASAEEGLGLAERLGCVELAQAIVVQLVLAEVQLERGEVALAQGHLDGALAAARNDPDLTPSWSLHLLQARLQLAQGEASTAAATVKRVERGLRGGAGPLLLTYRLAATGAEIELASGRPGAALERLAPLLSDPGPAADGLRASAARAHLSLQQLPEAEALARSVIDSGRSPLAQVEAWVVLALAADQRRDDHQALSALNTALRTAEPDGIQRPFLTPAHPRLESMLQHTLHLSPELTFGSSVLGRLAGSAGVAPSGRQLTEALTDRELVVLSHLATLQTNQEIAGELFVSINTVKAHARAVYRKLDVTSRRQAVQVARELGLL